jgi:hypothetical protein
MNNPGNWKERHFFNLNLNPQDKMQEDNPSTLPDPRTNPARYPDPEPGEAPTTPLDKESPNVEGAAAPPQTGRPPNPADPTAPPVAPVTQPTPGVPTEPVPLAAQQEVTPQEGTTPPA